MAGGTIDLHDIAATKILDPCQYRLFQRRSAALTLLERLATLPGAARRSWV
jgi:hypothetical protein